MLEPISKTMSLIYRRKSNGPKIEPCGTPARMNTQSEVPPGRTTRCFLLEIIYVSIIYDKLEQSLHCPRWCSG